VTALLLLRVPRSVIGTFPPCNPTVLSGSFRGSSAVPCGGASWQRGGGLVGLAAWKKHRQAKPRRPRKRRNAMRPSRLMMHADGLEQTMRRHVAHGGQGDLFTDLSWSS